jgi:hypothetical protein
VFGREAAMSWTSACSGLRAHCSRARSKRHARRVLAQELATYATAADRDELAALIAERGCTDCEAADVLAGQAYVDMLRDSDPPFWTFTGFVNSPEFRSGAR